MSSHNQYPGNTAPSTSHSPDEIDIRELALHLWKSRYFITAVTAVATALAFIYTLLAQPIYGSQAVLAPPSLASYGSLAMSLQARNETGTNTIATGRQLASDMFSILVAAIESPANQRKYFEHSRPRLVIQVDRNSRAGAAGSDMAPTRVTLDASGLDAVAVKASLDGYLRFAADIAAEEIRAFLDGAAIPVEIQPEVLFRLEQAPLVALEPIKPKKPLIIALGLVLGLMGGVFIALVRLTFSRAGGESEG